ncbi:hypothetical protein NM208_g12016 [Fusarium decemcellulare]|uniref:Uncharacterized protein n=1 Tax=Fusarium decemcellulare TaxID=57161 RepID=A0ACC1RS78_9HYPO|nr:hypothetical protein NM208_g12016 [Fusarium decemcellulare]
MADFKLSAQLIGHESDVRAVAFPSPDTVVTVSRDCSLRIWRSNQASPPNFDASLLSRGSEYINSVAVFPPSNDHPDGLVVSGGKDTIIEVKSPKAASSDNAERLLVGHAHNVCTLPAASGFPKVYLTMTTAPPSSPLHLPPGYAQGSSQLLTKSQMLPDSLVRDDARVPPEIWDSDDERL